MAKFKVGQSGNPEGRPKGSISITSAIRRKLEETNPKTKKQYLDDLVDVMIKKAVIEKDFRVIKEIWNHVDGSPRQTSEELGKEEKLPIPIAWGLSGDDAPPLEEMLQKYEFSREERAVLEKRLIAKREITGVEIHVRN